MKNNILPKGLGHRKRLRERFLQSGFEGFLDYEIVELLLTLGTPRSDCKLIAKNAINDFKDLRGVFDAPLNELLTIKGIGLSNVFGIKLFREISQLNSKLRIPPKLSLNNPKEVAEYLKEKYGRSKKEHFLTVLLDSRNNLISINEISVGILNSSLVHPREVFQPAISQFAANIILAHNHPSGDLNPSNEDLIITQRLSSVGEITGINIIDHIIISSNGYSSLKEKKLI